MSDLNPQGSPISDILEEWRIVVGFLNYEVSNLGRVRSLERQTMGRWGKPKTTPARVMNPELMKNGYRRVHLCINGTKTRRFVHRMVATAFIPNPNNKPQVNHKDCNRSNNVVTNLEWATAKENTDHGVQFGRIQYPTHHRAEIRAKLGIEGNKE